MKSLNHKLNFVLILLLLQSNCKSDDNNVTQQPTLALTQAEIIEVQRHVNRYFHSEVMPSLPNNWISAPMANTSIIFKINFSKTHNNNWEFVNLAKEHSSLLNNLIINQDEMALNAMSSAISNTSFPVNSENPFEVASSNYTLFWEFPAIFPEGTYNFEQGSFVALDNNPWLGSNAISPCFSCNEGACIDSQAGGEGCADDPCEILGACSAGGVFSL